MITNTMNAHSTYKPSKYNFILDTEDGGLLLYNTMTGAIDVIEPEKKEKIKYLFELKDIQQSDEEELLESLYDQGYLVDHDRDETADLVDWNYRSNMAENVCSLTILPTETCNFTCPYCFIYTFREKHMTADTFDAIVNYVINFLEKNKKEKKCHLEISWFGGEPLLVADNILAFMDRINGIIKNYSNVNMISGIVTNGYYLNYKLFKKLIDRGLTTFQVTLDGDAENHDKLRTLPNKGPTFDTIYHNLLDIVQNVTEEMEFVLSIRSNFLKSSIKNSKNLLEMYKKDFAHDNRFRIYFRPVYDFETDRNDIKEIESDICGSDEGVRVQNQLGFESLTNTENVLEKVANPLPQPTLSWCTSIKKNSHIIGYDGSVFSCDTMITEKDKAVGQLHADGTIYLNENADTWKKSIFEQRGKVANELIEECMTCKLLPVCMGGCNRSRLVTGTNPCFWNEELIHEAMREHARLNSDC